ncbi:hypothetical protein EPUL_003095 [Erysiphe pulchra]|uniref:Secreted effector protein n=1 Tax=Erysiphe pulchra TaxID=225359 RepID=A0A2S4PTI0_9PEZI|nr:hypothetical protein EPUL_003095 [Erysiphe pulchra]
MRKLFLITAIVLFALISNTSARTGSTIFTGSSRPSNSLILKRKVGRDEKPKSLLEGYRCVLNIYKREHLIEVKNEACKYINDGKKTWGFSRWPKPYKPPNRLQFPFYSNTFRLWPLEHDGKIFKGGFFKRSKSNNFIVLDGNCQFAGVVALYKSKATLPGPCPIIGCHAPTVKEYKNCEPMKVVSEPKTDSESSSERGNVKGRKSKQQNGKKAHRQQEAEEESEEAGEEEEESEEDES